LSVVAILMSDPIPTPFARKLTKSTVARDVSPVQNAVSKSKEIKPPTLKLLNVPVAGTSFFRGSTRKNILYIRLGLLTAGKRA